MAKLAAPAAAGFNAGTNFYARAVRVAEIVIDPEISGIFKIHDKTLAEIRRKIEQYGYDKSQPVVVQKGTNILVDGHTRLAAAREAGIEEIPAYEREFEDREAMLLYTFERQAVRRNLTGPEILAAARMIKGRKQADGQGRAAEILAERLGVGAATVYQARAILKEGSDEDISAVQNGEKSIKAAYNALKRKDGRGGGTPTRSQNRFRRLERSGIGSERRRAGLLQRSGGCRLCGGASRSPKSGRYTGIANSPQRQDKEGICAGA